MSTKVTMVVMFALALAYYMWRRIKGSLEHLEDEDIEEFLSKRLSDKEQKKVREHLLRCEECKLRMDELTKHAQKIKPDRWLKRRF